MFIIPLPWSRKELEYLRDENDVFDLCMKDSTQQYYLIIQENTITWVGQGTISGRVAYQIKSRSTTMNGNKEIPRNRGNVGFLGSFSGIEDAVLKIFPRNGYCVTDMNFAQYTGQKLKASKNHYNVIEPLLCLLRDDPSDALQHFFKILGWGGRTQFTCVGQWNNDMKLYIGEKRASTLEVWFANYCVIALG